MTYVHDKAPAIQETSFQLDSVMEVPAPEGGGGVWHRYVITQGSNSITGMRAGTRVEVDLLLRDIVERLNTRFQKQQAKLKLRR